MSYNVLFLKGTAEQYTAATKNQNTFYYTTDDKQFYLGEVKLSNAGEIIAAVERITKNENDIKTINSTLTTIQGDENVDGSIKKAVKEAKDALEAKIGNLEDLSTTAKGNLVSAINEVLAAVGAGGTAAAVTMDTTTTTAGMAKSYTLKQGENTIGTIDIPKDMVVKSGEVVVNPEGQTEGTYIVLTLANTTEDKIYVNVGTLVDIYKAKANATQIQLAIDSATREISATVVAGSITSTELADAAVVTAKIADGNVTKAKLSTEVQASLDKADSAIQAANLGSAAYADTDDFDAAGSAAAVVGTAEDTKDSNTVIGVRKYADSLDAAMDARVDVLEAAIGENGSVATQIDNKIAELDADVTSAEVENGKGVRVQVVEVDGKITNVAITGNYDNKYDAKGAATTAETNAKNYADSLAGNYATAAQGTKADTALQSSDITIGEANGTIAVKGTDVAVKGLGTAAYASADNFDAAGSANTALTNAKAYVDTALTWGTIA